MRTIDLFWVLVVTGCILICGAAPGYTAGKEAGRKEACLQLADAIAKHPELVRRQVNVQIVCPN